MEEDKYRIFQSVAGPRGTEHIWESIAVKRAKGKAKRCRGPQGRNVSFSFILLCVLGTVLSNKTNFCLCFFFSLLWFLPLRPRTQTTAFKCLGILCCPPSPKLDHVPQFLKKRKLRIQQGHKSKNAWLSACWNWEASSDWTFHSQKFTRINPVCGAKSLLHSLDSRYRLSFPSCLHWIQIEENILLVLQGNLLGIEQLRVFCLPPPKPGLGLSAVYQPVCTWCLPTVPSSFPLPAAH